jgi:hypothetical protein
MNAVDKIEVTVPVKTIKGRDVNVTFDVGLAFDATTKLIVDGIGEAGNPRRVMSTAGSSLKKAGFEADADFYYETFECDILGQKKGHIIFDEASSILIRNTIQQTRDDNIDALRAGYRAKAEAKKQEMDKKIPGLSVLQAAYADEEEYREAFTRMMEDEQNDGVRPPKAPRHNIAELEQQYPAAAIYIKADGYEGASNYLKSAAGKKAKALLLEGGTIEEAAAILDNWLPEDAVWN